MSVEYTKKYQGQSEATITGFDANTHIRAAGRVFRRDDETRFLFDPEYIRQETEFGAGQAYIDQARNQELLTRSSIISIEPPTFHKFIAKLKRPKNTIIKDHSTMNSVVEPKFSLDEVSQSGNYASPEESSLITVFGENKTHRRGFLRGALLAIPTTIVAYEVVRPTITEYVDAFMEPLATRQPTEEIALKPINESSTNSFQFPTETPNPDQEKLFEALNIPFRMRGWDILFKEGDLLVLAGQLEENERLVFGTKHSTQSLQAGLDAEIIAYPSPTITLGKDSFINYPEVETVHDEHVYVLPALNIDDVTLSCKRTDGKDWEVYELTIEMDRQYNFPHQVRESNPPAVHPEEAIDPLIMLEIKELMKQYQSMGINIWRIIMPQDQIENKPHTPYDGDLSYEAYVKDDTYAHLNIVFLPISLIDQDLRKATGQPGFPYLTAQAIDILTNPDFYKYDKFEDKLAALNDIIHSSLRFDDETSQPHAQRKTFYAEYLNAIVASKNDFHIPAAHKDIGHGYPYSGALALRDIIPLVKHDPKKIMTNLENLPPDDRATAHSILTHALDIILSISEVDEFIKFFPDSRELFAIIGYDPTTQKLTM